jgi:hypothetical protein
MVFRIYTLIAFLFLGFNIISAQGNLQFVQVIIVSDVVQTVPSGKVWKVESYQQHQVGLATNLPTNSCSELSRSRPYVIDNYSYYNVEGAGNGNTSFSNVARNNFPFWLKAGQTVKTTCPGDFLSILEFVITP